MEVEVAELKLKEMAHSEQHYFNRYVQCCTWPSSHALPKYCPMDLILTFTTATTTTVCKVPTHKGTDY